MEEAINEKDGKIHSFHVKAKSVPEAYYKALQAVHYSGYTLRTQYDRKNKDGSYLDPPGKDTKVLIEISEPFSQPRFPVLSYCERGKYIAEFLGAKNHLVVPYKELVEMVSKNKKFEATQWPYAYHQRLTAYPKADGSTINQLEIIADKIAEDTVTRRAVAITAVPEIDLYMKSDAPCLREIHLRAIENENKELMLNADAKWRSRDLYKAWGDNVIGITNLIARVAARLEEKIKRKVIVGPYTDYSSSLHIYGQDYTEKGMDKFFNNFPDLESFIKRAKTSEQVLETEIIPQIEDLKNEKTWKFPPESIKIMDDLIEGYRSGKFLP